MQRLLIQAKDYVIGIDMERAMIEGANNKYSITTDSTNFLSNISIPKSDNIVLQIEDNMLKVTVYYLAKVIKDFMMPYNKIRLM